MCPCQWHTHYSAMTHRSCYRTLTRSHVLSCAARERELVLRMFRVCFMCSVCRLIVLIARVLCVQRMFCLRVSTACVLSVFCVWFSCVLRVCFVRVTSVFLA